MASLIFIFYVYESVGQTANVEPFDHFDPYIVFVILICAKIQRGQTETF